MSKIDAARFVMNCQNWHELVFPIATHKKPVRVILWNGVRFESHFIYWPDIYGIFSQGIYTPPFLIIDQDDMVVDIGANIGVFSLYAATCTHNTIHAFEPFPDCFAALTHNIEINKKSNIVPHQIAVSDSSGIERISTAKDEANHLQKIADLSTDAFLEVRSTTLQHFMQQQDLEKIDFLKLDCEGAEGIILQSTPHSYLKRIRKIAMEFHNDRSSLKHDQIQSLLEDAGFMTKVIWNGTSVLGLLYAWQ